VIYLPINKSEAYINTHTQKEYYVIWDQNTHHHGYENN
jgi:hypothetical protein